MHFLFIHVHVGSYDSSVRVWDCRTRTYDPVQVLGEAKDSVTSLQLSSSEILTGYDHVYNVQHVVRHWPHPTFPRRIPTFQYCRLKRLGMGLGTRLVRHIYFMQSAEVTNQ